MKLYCRNKSCVEKNGSRTIIYDFDTNNLRPIADILLELGKREASELRKMHPELRRHSWFHAEYITPQCRNCGRELSYVMNIVDSDDAGTDYYDDVLNKLSKSDREDFENWKKWKEEQTN